MDVESYPNAKETYIMKLMQAILVAEVMILSVGTTFGEVVVREVPLRWEQVARLDGDEIFSKI